MNALKFIAVLLAFAALASGAFAETVAADSPQWRFRAETANVERHLGRDAIYLANGYADLPGVNFDTGVIEFDIAAAPGRAFLGLAFRMVGESDYEHFYIRTHQSGNPDANQYTPVFNSVTGWQIYSGEGFASATRYEFNAWMRVRIEVAADTARVFIDDTLTLDIPDLMRDRTAGGLALTAFEGAAHFSHFRFEPGLPPTTSAARVTQGAGFVKHWSVSEAMPEPDALVAAQRPNTQGSTTAVIEPNGILNIARHARWTRENNTVMASFNLDAGRPRRARMRFGFSDKVRIFVNGALLYEGDDTRQSRDYRFLGTVGLYDVLHLPLRRGRNVVTFAVTESHGGWAATAVVEPME